MSCLCGSDSWMDHSRYNATAASATDRGAVGRDIVAGNATDSPAAAARANADGRISSSAAAANPGDSVRRAVPVRTASYAGASYCCHDRYRVGCCPSYDCDRGPNPDGVARPAGVAVALPARGSAAVGAVAAASYPRVHETGESDPAAVGRCAVAGVAVPSAAAGPGCRAVAVGAVVPNAVAGPGYRAVVPGVAVPSAAAAQLAAAVGQPGGLAGGSVVLVGVAAGAGREQPDFPDSAPHRGLVFPARWQAHSLPTSRQIPSETGLISSVILCSSKVLSYLPAERGVDAETLATAIPCGNRHECRTSM